MAGFTLDTSGSVQTVAGSDTALNFYTWDRLSPFTQGYIEALFASLSVDVGFTGEWVAHLALTGSEQHEPAYSDLAPETLARIIADCERLATGWPQRGRAASSGRKFWADRQAGLYVRNNFPPLTVQLGDDGKVRFAEAPTQGEPRT